MLLKFPSRGEGTIESAREWGIEDVAKDGDLDWEAEKEKACNGEERYGKNNKPRTK